MLPQTFAAPDASTVLIAEGNAIWRIDIQKRTLEHFVLPKLFHFPESGGAYGVAALSQMARCSRFRSLFMRSHFPTFWTTTFIREPILPSFTCTRSNCSAYYSMAGRFIPLHSLSITAKGKLPFLFIAKITGNVMHSSAHLILDFTQALILRRAMTRAAAPMHGCQQICMSAKYRVFFTASPPMRLLKSGPI